MNKMKKFEVYSLDMLPDENGGWVENERQKSALSKSDVESSLSRAASWTACIIL